MLGCPNSTSLIRDGIKSHGISTGSAEILRAETLAAEQSVESGLYVTFRPGPYSTLGSSASDDVKSGVGQCCRIGLHSLCRCGHSLEDHHSPSMPKRGGYIRPPKCRRCHKCHGYFYVPFRPEECGQWWLPRRKDFNLKEWQQRVRQSPSQYACIGCDVSIEEHETIFETKNDRLARGAAVDEAYKPLADVPLIEDHARIQLEQGKTRRIYN